MDEEKGEIWVFEVIDSENRSNINIYGTWFALTLSNCIHFSLIVRLRIHSSAFVNDDIHISA